MATLREAVHALAVASHELEIKKEVFFRAVRRAIHPILPDVLYAMEEGTDGFIRVWISYSWLGQDSYQPGPDKRRLHEVILEVVPELERYIGSDVWIDQETAKRIQDALRSTR
jgi:hypothetical protein